MILTLFSDDPEVAAAADRAGVDRVGPDLEHLGKSARQGGLGWRISAHRESDIDAVGSRLSRARLLVRINPLAQAGCQELERVLGKGAQVVMLPMVRCAEEVCRFVDRVDGRACTIALIETASGLAGAGDIAAVPGLSEIHFGLNDLALDLGVTNRFGLLADARLERACGQVRSAGVRLGVGGIAPVDAEPPITPRLVYAALVRLGAEATLLSRSFLAGGFRPRLAAEVRRARDLFEALQEAPARELARAQRRLDEQVDEVGTLR